MFTASNMPQVLSIAIMITGSFVMYCFYNGYECTWRKEKLKDDIFFPCIHDNNDDGHCVL
jgi:hypothetical protein